MFIRIHNVAIRNYVVFIAIATTALASMAQDSSDVSTVTYDKLFFEQYRPVTLEDMIRRVPGGVEILSSLRTFGNDRGFGSTGAQILLDGKRISGKENDIQAALDRTQASQVERIDLIRGNAEGMDIRNEGILINVILKKDAKTKSTTFFSISAGFSEGTSFRPRGILSHSGSRNNLEYSIGFKQNRFQNFVTIDENRLNGSRAVVQFRDAGEQNGNRVNDISGTIKYDFENGDLLRLNGLYSENNFHRLESGNLFDVAADGARTFNRQTLANFRTFNDNWEIGGDYTRKFNTLGILKALFVINYKDQINNLFAIPGSTSPVYEVDFIAKEKIFRATFNKKLSDKQSIEYGAEAAFNNLDKSQNKILFPNDRAIVEEDRLEGFLTHNYTITSELNIQSSLNYEYSKIGYSSTSPATSNSREFKYIKPRVEIRYDFTEKDQLRVVVERDITQLNLNDFVASYDSANKTFVESNPNLIQEKTWKYSLTYEKRFADDVGTLETKIFYDDITDNIDKIETSPLRSAVGNIGPAHRYGIEIKSNLKLDRLGIPNVRISSKVSYHDTNVKDPFSGADRRIKAHKKNSWSVDFQHDLPRYKINYGLNINNGSQSDRYDIAVHDFSTSDLKAGGFIEYALPRNLKLKFRTAFIVNDKSTREVDYYDAGIASGIISRIDLQQRAFNRFGIFTLSGTF